MVDLSGEYDVDAEASNGFEALPPGRYTARLIDAKREAISRTKDSGDCLALTWKVEGGEHDGRLFWQRLNLWFHGTEKSPGKVRQIANGEFRAIRDAVGVPMPANTDELLERSCVVVLKNVTDNRGNPRAEVSAVYPPGDSKAASGQQAAPRPQQAAPPATQRNNPFQRAASR